MDFATVVTVLLTVASPSLGTGVFIPQPIDCRLVLCALPPCINPLPPPPGQCCPTCPVPSPLVCPPLPPGSVGICVELCSGDDSCPHGQKCCSNGCGHVCKVAVSPNIPPVCWRGGNVYKVGQSFPAGDGCNTCTCVRPGVIVCTRKACVRRGGKVYKVGQRFPAGDGCNTCTCIQPGVIVCTEIACPPPPTCPPDKPRVYCFVDHCQVTTCPAHPEARCVSDLCGGCNARFFNDEGNEVTKSCRCPIKGQQFNRCGSACPPTCTNPNPICTLQCVPRCQCPRGKVLDKRRKKCVFLFQCFH